MKRAATDRHASRFPFLQPVGLEMWEQGGGHCRQEGTGVDLSNEGGGLATQYPLHRGDVVKLLIPVGEMDLRVPVYAQVAWSKAADDGYRAGVIFLA